MSSSIIDRLGKRFALFFGASLVIISMAGFALTVTNVQAAAALSLIFSSHATQEELTLKRRWPTHTPKFFVAPQKSLQIDPNFTE